jgi:hypothetical protein
MSVPEQVRKQSEAVQALYDDVAAPAETPSPVEGEGSGAKVVDLAPTPAVPANSVVEPAPTSAPVEQGTGEPEETFEQKYRTLQGMYNAEVPRMNAMNQELTTRVQQLEGLISTMQNAPEPQQAVAPQQISALTDAEREEYGESIDIMRKVTQDVVGEYQQQIANLTATVGELQGQLVPRVEQIGAAQVQSAEQNFWSSLSSTVPNWRAINDHPDFQSWLLETDPLSGLTRQTYLDDAQRNLDHIRVAGFFSSWSSATGAAVAQPQPSAAISELEKQIQPGKSRSGGAIPAGEPKTYTPQDITKFFEKVRTGGFAGKEDARNAIERDIFAAQSEGRIVNA